jgi:hypothetical protein
MKAPSVPIAESYAGGSLALRRRIADTRDVAAMLGVSRQRVGQLVKEDLTFPYRFTEISGGRLWHRAGIELWIAAHRPTVPHQAVNPFGRAAAELLLAAEAIADEIAPGHVGTLHVWLAIARSEDRRIHRTLASLGVDGAEFERAARFFLDSRGLASRSRRMNPHLQEQLHRAAAMALDAGRQVDAVDLVRAFIDGDERFRGQRHDGVLSYLERRGLEIAELRRRLDAAALEEAAVERFEARALTKRRPARRRRRRRPELDLAPNPLGNDPWDLSWGAAFAVRKDGRRLIVGGEQWFFRTDGDGYYIRTKDGRPVGYRYRIDPPPSRGRGNPRPVNGFEEVLPMPPSDVDHWPDHRFRLDD